VGVVAGDVLAALAGYSSCQNGVISLTFRHLIALVPSPFLRVSQSFEGIFNSYQLWE
jgi:hypothetical protein